MARTVFQESQYQGIANTIVQLIRQTTWGVISTIAANGVGRGTPAVLLPDQDRSLWDYAQISEESPRSNKRKD